MSRTAVAPKIGADDASAEWVFQLLREQRSAAMTAMFGTRDALRWTAVPEEYGRSLPPWLGSRSMILYTSARLRP